jgi:chemotaxis protein MotB
MNKWSLCAVALALVASCGIPKDQFNAKALEAEDLSRKYKDEEGKTASLEQKVRDLAAQLLNKEAERKRLEQRNAEIAALNDELGRSTKKLAQAKEELEKKSSEYEGLAQSLKGEIQTGKIELSELKGKMTVKMKDKILFASGSARIGKEGQEALAKVADAFKNLQGKIVRVEGHTDDVPTDPKSAFPTNWELSLARAMAVLKYMQDQGVDPTLLSAAGYGQYHPIAPNDSSDNRSQNRRIEIVLAPAG